MSPPNRQYMSSSASARLNSTTIDNNLPLYGNKDSSEHSNTLSIKDSDMSNQILSNDLNIKTSNHVMSQNNNVPTNYNLTMQGDVVRFPVVQPTYPSVIFHEQPQPSSYHSFDHHRQKIEFKQQQMSYENIHNTQCNPLYLHHPLAQHHQILLQPQDINQYQPMQPLDQFNQPQQQAQNYAFQREVIQPQQQQIYHPYQSGYVQQHVQQHQPHYINQPRLHSPYQFVSNRVNKPPHTNSHNHRNHLKFLSSFPSCDQTRVIDYRYDRSLSNPQSIQWFEQSVYNLNPSFDSRSYTNRSNSSIQFDNSFQDLSNAASSAPSPYMKPPMGQQQLKVFQKNHFSTNITPTYTDLQDNHHLPGDSLSFIGMHVPYPDLNYLNLAREPNVESSGLALSNKCSTFEPMFNEKQFKTQSDDLKIINIPNDHPSPLSGASPFDAANHATTVDTKANNNDDSNFGNQSLLATLFISKFNSTRFLKFAEIHFSSFLQTIEKLNISADQFPSYDIDSDKCFRKSREKLLLQWNDTQSSLSLNFCTCMKFVSYDSKPSACPFKCEEPILNHKNVTFSIELFNNFIISILNNKSLRSYLKNTIRPQKDSRSNTYYLQGVHDGSIYSDEKDADLDFIFTFTIVSPNLKMKNPNSDNYAPLCLVLNELPPELKYRPEFVFLICFNDLNQPEPIVNKLLEPMFLYFEHLRNNPLRISLNRHEYRFKILLLFGLSNADNNKRNLLNASNVTLDYPCSLCPIPSVTVENQSCVTYSLVYNSRKIERIDKNNYKETVVEPMIRFSERKREKLYKTKVLDSLSFSKHVFVDPLNATLLCVFKNGILRFCIDYLKSKRLSSIEQSIKTAHELENLFKNPKIVSQLTNSIFSVPTDSIDIDDLKVLQRILPFFFRFELSEMFDASSRLKENITYRLKSLSVLLELNSYISVLFCSEITKSSLQLIKRGFSSLIEEIENLSKSNKFEHLNKLLNVSLHYMIHLYNDWEKFGTPNVASLLEMDKAIDKYGELVGTNAKPLKEKELCDRVKLLNIQNCMKVFNYRVPKYSTFEFMEIVPIPGNQLSQRWRVKVNEFCNRFLSKKEGYFEDGNYISFENIGLFRKDHIENRPSLQPTRFNLARIRNFRRSVGWRYIYINSMNQITHMNHETNEKVSAVFIEYRMTNTEKWYCQTTRDRPKFQVSESLSMDAPSREMKSVWLDDIRLVNLRVVGETHWIYDPQLTLDSVFNI